MKYIILALVMSLSSFMLVMPVHADEDEARTKHFEVEEPKSWQEAVSIIETKGAEMKAAYAAKDYAKMHELSYSLEVSADYLEEASETLLESVEDVHHQTEDEELDKLKASFPKFEASLADITGK